MVRHVPECHLVRRTSLSSSSSSNFDRLGIAAAVGGEDGGVLSSSSSVRNQPELSTSTRPEVGSAFIAKDITYPTCLEETSRRCQS